MDTSDDPVFTPIFLGAGFSATTAAGLATAATAASIGIGTTALMGGFKKPDKSRSGFATAAPGQATKTSEPVLALSEQAKRNRRLAASSLTREFTPPTLGISALVGA